MVWIHGGGDRGTGSSWVYDGGSLVHQSLSIGKPVIMVAINFRLGLFGFAASSALREDNKIAGEDGVGNYGLRDQRKALEWLHHFISEFGGDPSNITLFGESTGAADIISHLLSSPNESHPLFHRAIIQTPILDTNIPDVRAASLHLLRTMASLRVATLTQLRAVPADRLAVHGRGVRTVDDGYFLRKNWREMLVPGDAHKHHHGHHHAEKHLKPPHLLHAHERRSRSHSPYGTRRPKPHSPLPTASPPSPSSPGLQPLPTGLQPLPTSLQPLIIGDTSPPSLPSSPSISLWSSPGIVRRLRAITQSLPKCTALLRAYDIASSTPHGELVERVGELVGDARVGWPVECVVEGARGERGGRGVWRYLFDQEYGVDRECVVDQEGRGRGAADLVYLFGNVPVPLACTPESSGDGSGDSSDVDVTDGLNGVVDDTSEDGTTDDIEWLLPRIDAYTYLRIRDALQQRWLTFAHGVAPWSDDPAKIFVFGPEGEVGERSLSIFEGRRRRGVWRDVLEPLGMAVVQKVGVELGNGPAVCG
ncbi:hypothetical protein PLICRDRAFT_37981 [Plicaturopsis crispa FD-325 SS-3]|nr:hypothetical protein PLICRDRAFT_37981 [Plicaturopsis crispa FD-325 SS-3]